MTKRLIHKEDKLHSVFRQCECHCALTERLEELETGGCRWLSVYCQGRGRLSKNSVIHNLPFGSQTRKDSSMLAGQENSDEPAPVLHTLSYVRSFLYRNNYQKLISNLFQHQKQSWVCFACICFKARHNGKKKKKDSNFLLNFMWNSGRIIFSVFFHCLKIIELMSNS